MVNKDTTFPELVFSQALTAEEIAFLYGNPYCMFKIPPEIIEEKEALNG